MELSKNLDSAVISKLVSPFVEQATCLDCCKLYIAPETASCGHTSCHACWRKRKSCVCCAAPLDRSTLKLNVPIETITEHVHTMCDLFEDIFNFRVDTFSIGDGFTQRPSEPDPTNDVNNWLSSSQNHFSAPISSESTQDVTTVEQLTSTVQVHSHTKKVLSPQKVVLKQAAQDDWEKIEQLPDTDELIVKQTKNVDLSNEYSTEHPRRSSRKREIKQDDHISKKLNASKDKCSSKNSSIETENKTLKTKQKWNNVKKMRKEFSKLNKQNKSKLNVSIEMCKKNNLNQVKPNSKDEITAVDLISGQLVNIEDDTPSDNTKNIPQGNKHVRDYIVNKNINTSKNNGIKSPINASRSGIKENQNEEVFKSGTCKMDITEDEKTNIICSSNHDLFNNDKEAHKKTSFYKKGTLHIETDSEVKNNVQTVNYNIDCSNSRNADDIEITIKIGDTVANIFFKRKKNEPSKSCTNQEIQTSIGHNTLENISHCDEKMEIIETSIKNCRNTTVADINKLPVSNNMKAVEPSKLNKSVSTKKNTASAETVTAQFEITDSVEKELSSVMELEEREASNNQSSKILHIKGTVKTNPISLQLKNHQKPTQHKNVEIENPDPAHIVTDYLNDQDIFDSGSVQEPNVHVLKNVKNAPSEILIPTMKTNKGKNFKKAEKRNREPSEDIEMINKKQKVNQDSPKINDTVEFDKSLQKEFAQDCEGMNYDAVMGQVFANIDADIHISQKSKSLTSDTQPVEKPSKNVDQQKTVVLAPENPAETLINCDNSCNDNAAAPEEYSENVFSVVEKENDPNKTIEEKDQNTKAVEESKENLTPEIFVEEGDKLFTPHENIEDDDKSVVEETPQKSVSFTKPKNKSESAQLNLSLHKQKSSNESQARSVIDVSDSETSSKLSKEATVIDIARKTETPLTINRFVEEIKHKSTPVARKSLNFDQDDDDSEQTLCPTTEPAKTTQEKEFMSKAFENTPKSPVRTPLMARNVKVDVKPYCLAGSCLSSMELMKVKLLCRQNNWKYVDKYTNELTHLVVGVDDENKSQRSVKYMCALAASKWIVSFRWIDVCLSTNKIVNEEYFEALDGTGEPGPKRSRIAKKKLFEGITFYCMPPFSVLDVDTLKSMLEAAGGKVVNEVRCVRAEAGPALLLAEPENTQENKFIYMAVKLSIVPVNYEWVLNCLGSYSLSSIHELLLCPAALLPAAAAAWPRDLVSQDD